MNGQRPAWREPMLWLAAGIPLATLVAGFATLHIAGQSGAMDAAPEAVQRTAQTQTSDLSADQRASMLGLMAKLEISPQGALLLTGLGTDASATTLELHLIHPTSAANDLRIVLHREGGHWRGAAQFDQSIPWRVQLHGPGRQWRLVARFAPMQHEVLLQPALAVP